MKKYFEQLGVIGQTAVIELRDMDKRHNELAKSYFEEYKDGKITDYGYRGLIGTLDKEREKTMSVYRTKISAVKQEYEKATNEYMMPSSGRMHMDDIELLKNFSLSVPEFEGMAEKYRDNPTMGRLLDNYRKEHELDTSWRFQGIEKRKQVFNSVCNSIESIIKQDDKYCPDRVTDVERRISEGYHALQGNDTEAIPMPEAAEVRSGAILF